AVTGSVTGLAVEGTVPSVGVVDKGAAEVPPPVDAGGAAKGYETGGEIRGRAGAARPRRNRGIAPELHRVREERIESLVGHHQRDDFRHRYARLKADARRGERIERRPDPLAGPRIARHHDAAPAGPTQNEPRLGDLRRDQ